MSRLLGAVAAAVFLTAIVVVVTAVSQEPGEGRPASREGSLKVGDPAPDFTLKTLDGSAEVTLSSYEGECPVALLFGSYT